MMINASLTIEKLSDNDHLMMIMKIIMIMIIALIGKMIGSDVAWKDCSAAVVGVGMHQPCDDDDNDNDDGNDHDDDDDGNYNEGCDDDDESFQFLLQIAGGPIWPCDFAQAV